MNSAKISVQAYGLHEQAIEATLVLIERSQSQKPCLAEVAEALDVPEARLAAMFPASEDLLVATIEQALVRLIDACTRSVVRCDPDDPVAQFIALGDAYLTWASEHPSQFRLMSDRRLMETFGNVRLRRYLAAVNDLMGKLLVRAQQAGHLDPTENIDLLMMGSRSYGYGLARMVVDGRMRDWLPDCDPLDTARQLARSFVQRLVRGRRVNGGA